MLPFFMFSNLLFGIINVSLITGVNSMQQNSISPELAKSFRRNFLEKLIEFGLLLSAVIAVFITTAIVYILVTEAIPFFQTCIDL